MNMLTDYIIRTSDLLRRVIYVHRYDNMIFKEWLISRRSPGHVQSHCDNVRVQHGEVEWSNIKVCDQN